MTRLRLTLALLLILGLAAGEIKNKGWWRNAVFYQIYPRSFKDSDGDGVGDIKGVTEKLNHFVESGITAVWLSPIFTSPMVDFGYDIADFKDIDRTFGTLDDLEELTREAKKLGIKVILDLVPNHSSDEHEWFKKSVKKEGKYGDYYIWRKGKDNNSNPPNNWNSVFNGPGWSYHPERQLWYWHQFDPRQPDLNYANPIVQEEMKDVIKFWLSKGIDGFRVDAVPHLFERDDLEDEPRNPNNNNPHDYDYWLHIYTKDDPRTYDLVQSWRKVMDDWAHEHNEDEKVMLTEAYTSLENTTRFYKHGAQVPFNFYFITSVNANSTPSAFKKIVDDWLANTPPGEVANWVMGNHDRKRTATRYPGRADQMTMLAMILPGIAVTYNGEEIGMVDKYIPWSETQDPLACNSDDSTWELKTRDPNRTPFQWDNTTSAGFSNSTHTWLPVHENYKTLNLAAQKTNGSTHYNVYRKLTELRKTDTLKDGPLKMSVLNDEQVLVVMRSSPTKTNEKMILVINFSEDKSFDIDLTPVTDNKVFKLELTSVETEPSKLDGTKIHLQAKSSVLLTSSANFLSSSLKLLLLSLLLVFYKFL